MKKNRIIILAVFFIAVFFFEFRLLETPRGITLDEAAFGYNAALISETLHDENGRFLPFFVLSLEGRDWRQPVTQYLQVVMFKLFGKSLYKLKLVSVLTAAFSATVVFFLAFKIYKIKFGIIALIIFITTPIIMIHSHLALDNISPVPFILLWMVGVWYFKQKKSLKYLILAGVSLGIGFYTHKSMRSAVPIWTILTVIFLIYNLKKPGIDTFKKFKPAAVFLFSITPFYLISPILNYKYAGAVFGSDAIGISSVFSFFEFYLSNFDLSFLFITGDKILHHSTGIHGMFLLASLPAFIYGIYKSFKEKNPFFIFLAVCFFAGPLLLGFIGSVHRASRIIFLVPIFTFISAYGALKFFELRINFSNAIKMLLCTMFAINYVNFINYYWFQYPKDTYHIFYNPVGLKAYNKLYQISKQEKFTPYISDELLKTEGDGGTIEDFSRSLYFAKPEIFKDDAVLPGKSILLTTDNNFKSGKKVSADTENYFLYIVN